jgi:intracellular septation protein A
MTIGDTHRVTVKIVYLVVLAAVLFFIRDPLLLSGLLALQAVLLASAHVPPAAVWRATRRLWLLFAVIAVSYAFMSTGQADERWVEFTIGGWTPAVNLTGLAVAGLMCLRVFTLVLASTWLQRSSPPGALVAGLERLRVPQSVAVTVDATLALLGGERGTGQGGGRHGKSTDGPTLTWDKVRAGRLDFVQKLIDRSLDRAREWLAARHPQLTPERLHDLTIVLAVSLTIMGLKVLQVLPGVPIASGHKNLLIVPLLLFAAHATHMRFGGLAAGTAAGIVSFLLGYGKFGILEIAHFAVPGLFADLLMPLARARSRGGRLLQFALIGFTLGLGRFAANFLVIVLAGAPQLAFLLFAPMLVSQVAFGALSCLVSVLIVGTPHKRTANQ